MEGTAIPQLRGEQCRICGNGQFVQGSHKGNPAMVCDNCGHLAALFF